MNSVDRHDSAIPMAHYDCKDDASNLRGTVCHKLTGRKTSFKRTLQEVRVELHSKCNRMQVELPYTLKKKKNQHKFIKLFINLVKHIFKLDRY